LVELVPYNLLTWSEDFTNASWVKLDATITANVGIAPDGKLTADRLTATANLGTIIQSSSQIVQSYTHSIWVKAESGTVSGSIFGISSAATRTDFVATTEWQRITNTAVSQGGNRFPQIRLDLSGTSILIWGAQLVEGTSALDYQATETRLNIPRLDYSLGSCPNILLEPQRTNLALFSEQFDNAAWGKNATSVTANSTTSPSGLVNADTLTSDGSSAQHIISQSTTFTQGVSYTLSVYLKKGTNNFAQLYSFVSNGGMFANFDLNNGVVGSVGTVTGSNPTSSITNVGNGWYRCTMTFVPTITQASAFAIMPVTSASAARAESNTLSTSIFLWGAQLEAGAYATSYIPTTSASVTRNQDIVNKTGISSLIGQTEGVIYWEGIATMQTDILGTNRSTVNGIYITKHSGNLFRVFIYNSSNLITLTDTIIRNSNTKIAVSYKSGNTSLFVNGVKVATSSDSLTFNASLDAIRLNDNYLIGINSFFTKSVLVYKTALTDGEMSMLTSGVYTPALAYAQLGLVSESPACLDSSVNALL
jgi:hypothetical protein